MEIDIKLLNTFKNTIDAETSDRAKIIIACSQLEYLLELKLTNTFVHGNKVARKKLFSDTGIFSTFASKINIAFCGGWIDPDVYHDLELLRKIRNEFAHSYENISFNNIKVKKSFKDLRVPLRKYFDWGRLKAAELEGGFILYADKKPIEAGNELKISDRLYFTLSLSVIFATLIENLKIKVSFKNGKIFL